MTSFIDLQAIERRAYRTLWEDGLVDAAAGLGMVGTGVAWLTGNVAFGGLVPVFMVPFWAAARKVITHPRAGVVRLADDRMSGERRKLAGLVTAGAATFLVAAAFFILTSRQAGAGNDLARAVVPALPCALLALASFLVAVVFGIGRFLAYGVLLMVVAAGGTLLQMEPGWQILAGGTGVTLWGLVLLIHFMKRHPAPSEPESRA